MAPACTLILHRGTFVAWNSQMFRRNRGAWLPGNRIITVMENAPNQSLRLVENWTSKSAGICYSGFDIADRFLFFSSQIGESKKSGSKHGSSHPCFMASWKASDFIKNAPFSSHLQKDMNVNYWVLPPTPCNSLKRFTICCRDRDYFFASFLRLGFFGRIQYYSNIF